MVRVNLEDKVRDEKFIEPELEPEIRAPRRRPPEDKKLGFKRSCCLLFLIIILFFSITVVAAIAKTGIIEIPVFSKIFYKIPEPNRNVEIDDFQAMASKSLNVAFDIEQGLINLELTEEELTFILRQALSGKPDSYFSKNFQVTISDGQIELFGLLLKPVSANLMLKIKPYLVGGELGYDITAAKIGSLTVPANLANWMLNRLTKTKDREIDLQKNGITLTNIELEEGKIKLAAEVKAENIQNIIKNVFSKLIDLSPDNLNKK